MGGDETTTQLPGANKCTVRMRDAPHGPRALQTAASVSVIQKCSHATRDDGMMRAARRGRRWRERQPIKGIWRLAAA